MECGGIVDEVRLGNGSSAGQRKFLLFTVFGVCLEYQGSPTVDLGLDTRLQVWSRSGRQTLSRQSQRPLSTITGRGNDQLFFWKIIHYDFF